eukprot:1062134-Amphidinium_carterae.1
MNNPNSDETRIQMIFRSECFVHSNQDNPRCCVCSPCFRNANLLGCVWPEINKEFAEPSWKPGHEAARRHPRRFRFAAVFAAKTRKWAFIDIDEVWGSVVRVWGRECCASSGVSGHQGRDASRRTLSSSPTRSMPYLPPHQPHHPSGAVSARGPRPRPVLPPLSSLKAPQIADITGQDSIFSRLSQRTERAPNTVPSIAVQKAQTCIRRAYPWLLPGCGGTVSTVRRTTESTAAGLSRVAAQVHEHKPACYKQSSECSMILLDMQSCTGYWQGTFRVLCSPVVLSLGLSLLTSLCNYYPEGYHSAAVQIVTTQTLKKTGRIFAREEDRIDSAMRLHPITMCFDCRFDFHSNHSIVTGSYEQRMAWGQLQQFHGTLTFLTFDGPGLDSVNPYLNVFLLPSLDCALRGFWHIRGQSAYLLWALWSALLLHNMGIGFFCTFGYVAGCLSYLGLVVSSRLFDATLGYPGEGPTGQSCAACGECGHNVRSCSWVWGTARRRAVRDRGQPYPGATQTSVPVRCGAPDADVGCDHTAPIPPEQPPGLTVEVGANATASTAQALQYPPTPIPATPAQVRREPWPSTATPVRNQRVPATPVEPRVLDSDMGAVGDVQMGSSEGRARVYCPVPGCLHADAQNAAGWSTLAGMRVHLDEHALGRLARPIPPEFLEAQ